MFAIAALKEVGTHADGCEAVKEIGRFGSRAGLRWSAGDLGRCSCRLGLLMAEAADANAQRVAPLPPHVLEGGGMPRRRKG